MQENDGGAWVQVNEADEQSGLSKTKKRKQDQKRKIEERKQAKHAKQVKQAKQAKKAKKAKKSPIGGHTQYTSSILVSLLN